MQSKHSNDVKINILWITIFSIAMAYLESAVVVYLRAIYYPDGFFFPINPINELHTVTEIGRELATLIMFLSIGILSAKNNWHRFAVFLYSFAVWDIFYYIFLKALLDWPSTIMEWDILFLIPTVWTGPVLAPVISSFTMIALALIIIYSGQNNHNAIGKKVLTILISGAVIQILAYTWDFSVFLNKYGNLKRLFLFDYEKLVFQYSPDKFPWFLFGVSEVIIIYALWMVYKNKSGNNSGI